MALAFPGQSGTLWEIMVRDAFLESLGDPALHLCVLYWDPETLEQALKLASWLESLRQSEREDNWDDIGRHKDRIVRSTDKASGMTALMVLMSFLLICLICLIRCS